ncbi:hypothetical protein HKD37_10G029333 [Glycine soja]
MKCPLPPSASGSDVEDKKMKKAKAVENDDNVERMEGLVHFDDNLLFEVLNHVDGRTLAMSGCR